MTQPKIEGVGHGIPRMLYASDGSNWYAILVDSDGHVKIDIVTYPGSNALGNFPFGYYDTYQQVATVTDTGAGEYQAVGATVPTGEVWIVTHIACRHNSTASIVLDVDLRGVTTVRIFGNRTLAQYIVDGKQGVWVLKAGNYITADFVTLGTGKIGYLNLIGYKMKVA